ncbi:hypothetical protein Godav_021265 [Gossypium davidsonii]|uniref:Ribosomal protein L10e/L16 domain-containing protein n=2 Tax=Gossypium TaxID=3633 RepID=A0A7J8R617_GOSDV|nr:hypothetical protein [Gossypium davidsonii]MBA0644191.1 hypothetical protein [Gossypium klotzschianum]
MTRNLQCGGKIWVHIFPDKLVTVRPTKTRMGLGKRSPDGARELMCIRAIGANNF